MTNKSLLSWKDGNQGTTSMTYMYSHHDATTMMHDGNHETIRLTDGDDGILSRQMAMMRPIY